MEIFNSNKSNEAKIKDLLEIFDYISDTNNFNLYDLNFFNLN